MPVLPASRAGKDAILPIISLLVTRRLAIAHVTQDDRHTERNVDGDGDSAYLDGWR